MTWYANNLYMPATYRVLNALKSNISVRPFLYVVKNLDRFSWHTPEVKHSVGSEGLAVVRPLAAINGESAGWYGEQVLDWTSLCPRAAAMSSNSAPSDDEEPPSALLEFLAEISASTNAPAVYYSSFMWGGDVEHEISWVVAPKLIKYITEMRTLSSKVRCIAEGADETIDEGDALRKGLNDIGVELPTGFFALHTRSFPWENYRELNQ